MPKELLFADLLVDPAAKYMAAYQQVEEMMRGVREPVWDLRFLELLNEAGLRLSLYSNQRYHITAPRPRNPNKPTWSRNTYIVEADNLHPLHHDKMWEVVDPRETDSYRHTGRSTILALKFIAQALEQPANEIFIEDHYFDPNANAMLVKMVQEMIARLRLEHLHIYKDAREGMWILRFQRIRPTQ